MLLAQANPQLDEDEVFVRLMMLRSKAWPNSLMVPIADELLGREGRLTEALHKLYAYQLKRQAAIEDWWAGTRGRHGVAGT